MKRFIAIFYNNSGRSGYAPIRAKDKDEAEAIAKVLTETRETSSGGTEFLVEVLTIHEFLNIAANAATEPRPFTKKELDN